MSARGMGLTFIAFNPGERSIIQAVPRRYHVWSVLAGQENRERVDKYSSRARQRHGARTKSKTERGQEGLGFAAITDGLATVIADRLFCFPPILSLYSHCSDLGLIPGVSCPHSAKIPQELPAGRGHKLVRTTRWMSGLSHSIRASRTARGFRGCQRRRSQFWVSLPLETRASRHSPNARIEINNRRRIPPDGVGTLHESMHLASSLNADWP
ncbi:hypothetical protein B0H14DRAFT_3135054 [Mycena olivaceomarginata]|nr:hypothetical protein B0H14DRAFT_3135054 [Mycena olivaceomarginata]